MVDHPKDKKEWKFGYDLDFYHGEATGWLEGQLVGLFTGLYDRQPSEVEMEQIRGLTFAFVPELRATLLETITTIRKSTLKNTNEQITQ
ncbi:MAG: hypothetical protein EPO63_01585 [Candidatus Nitrosotenuis sp.]|nr:MAG: hypothetical protein EPO63_01585 [Candidatus Nitrosotenuis sp.]